MANRSSIDENGFCTFRDCKFFCECIADYLGSEIDPTGEMGLNPRMIYKVYRPKSEIAKKDFIESLNAKPILDDHTVIGNVPGMVSPDRINTAGTLSEVKLCGNELHGRIDVWSKKLIDKIRKGKVELSLSYDAAFVPKKGMFNGERYDFVQSNLRCGNHLAFVDEARNGHDCRVRDGAFVRDEKIKLENPEMDISKLSADEVIEALKGCSDEIKAKCKDFLNTPTEEERKAAEDAAKAEAEKKAKEEAEAKEQAEKKAAEDAAKAAEDAAKAEEDKKEEIANACDSAIKSYRKAESLVKDCRPMFGDIAMDAILSEDDVVKHIAGIKDLTGPALKVQRIIADAKPDCAVSALRCALAMGVGSAPKTNVSDSAPKAKMSFRDYMSNR